jgi:hypothetical protein
MRSKMVLPARLWSVDQPTQDQQNKTGEAHPPLSRVATVVESLLSLLPFLLRWPPVLHYDVIYILKQKDKVADYLLILLRYPVTVHGMALLCCIVAVAELEPDQCEF